MQPSRIEREQVMFEARRSLTWPIRVVPGQKGGCIRQQLLVDV